jgi:hypothetical protein
MRYWIYKCNAKNEDHQVWWGDWDSVFGENELVVTSAARLPR